MLSFEIFYILFLLFDRFRCGEFALEILRNCLLEFYEFYSRASLYFRSWQAATAAAMRRSYSLKQRI
jgi:hypothetical protein